MSKKFGLGKGLNALIPEDTVILEPKKGKDKNDDNGYSLIDINLIKSNESQPRKSFDDEKIMELAESIKSNGIYRNKRNTICNNGFNRKTNTRNIIN